MSLLGPSLGLVMPGKRGEERRAMGLRGSSLGLVITLRGDEGGGGSTLGLVIPLFSRREALNEA